MGGLGKQPLGIASALARFEGRRCARRHKVRFGKVGETTDKESETGGKENHTLFKLSECLF